MTDAEVDEVISVEAAAYPGGGALIIDWASNEENPEACAEKYRKAHPKYRAILSYGDTFDRCWARWRRGVREEAAKP